MANKKISELTVATAMDMDDAVAILDTDAGATKSATKEILLRTSYALPTDEDYEGETTSGIVGEAVAFPDVLYFDLSEQKWKKADYNLIATVPGVVIALETKVDGETCKLLKDGFVRYDTWDWTIDDTKKILYLGASGAISQDPVAGSGDYSQAVGMIMSADKIMFRPSLAMAKHV